MMNILLVIITYNIEFTLNCDDFCNRVIDSNNIPYDVDSSHQNQCNENIKTFDIPNSKYLLIEVENKEGPFSLAAAYLNFHYFEISSKPEHKSLWTIGKPNESCYPDTVTKTFQDPSILIGGNNHNYQICTFNVSLNFCNEDNVIYYYYKSNIRHSLDIKAMLKVSWKCPKCDDMLIAFKSQSLTGITLIMFYHYQIILGSGYRLENAYYFLPNDDVPLGTIDSITIDYIDSITATTLASCPLTLIACGDNCVKCDSNSCLVCSPNFAHYETPLSKHCVSKSEYNNYENFAYIAEGDYYVRCYYSCKNCHKSGTNSFHNCNQCQENYFSFQVNDNTGNPITNCVSNCKDNVIHRYTKGTKCVQSCDNGEYSDDYKCVTFCENKIKNDITHECVTDCITVGYLSTVTGEKKCSVSCFQPFFASIASNGEKECGLSCPITYNYYIIDSTQNINECINECPKNTYILMRGVPPYKCIDTCPYYSYHNRECYQSCPSNTYTIQKKKKCVDECLDEVEYKYYKNEMKCVEECDNVYPHLIRIDSNCTDFCPDTLKYISEDDKECLKDCNGLFIDISINKCESSCLNSQNNKLEYLNICVDTCPVGFINKNNKGICKRDLKLTDIDDRNSKISLQLNEAIPYIRTYLKDYLEEDKIVRGDGFITQIYYYDTPHSEDYDISSIDLSRCEQILRKKYSIPDKEKLIIVKYDLIQEYFLINQVEYKVYSQNGTELSLTVCEDVNVIISYPYTSKDDIDMQSGYKMSLEGIDVFNSKDPFFNDPCYSYDVNGSNLVLNDRRKEYYQNITLCETECQYKGIDYHSKNIQCECQTKTDFTTLQRGHDVIQNNNYSSNIKSLNLIITKCFNEFIKYKKWKNNIGFWFSLSVLVFQLISILLLIIIEKNYLLSLIHKHQENNPPHFFGSTFSNKLGKQYNESEELYFNDTFISTDNKKKSKETDLDNMFKREKQEIHNTYIKDTFDIDNYPFYVALLLDKRNCLTIFTKILKESNILFRSFFVKSKYELISINFGYLLFFIGLLFSVNAVFYDETLISKKYHNDITFNDLLIRIVVSLVVTCIIMKIVSYFKYYAPVFDLLDIEISDSLHRGEHITKQIKEIRNKMIMFFTLIMLSTLFFIYYLTLYCMIYNKTQINWFISAWLSLAIYFSLCFIYSFLFSVLKVLSLRYHLKRIYNLLLYIKSSF